MRDAYDFIGMKATGDKEKCLDAGMDDYITKPIKRESVFEMIEKWVVGRDVS